MNEVVGDLKTQIVSIKPTRPLKECSNSVLIQQNAIFLADCHYASYRQNLLYFLKDILALEQVPPQIFLMGDIFDLLIGDIVSLVQSNKEILDIIALLSNRCEIFYFEGNHDFNLHSITQLANVTIIPRKEQPKRFYLCKEGLGLQVMLAHGDIGVGLKYECYASVIRNKFILVTLNKINKHLHLGLLEKLENHLKDKTLLTKCDNFLVFAKRRLQYYKQYGKIDLIIEGHFHFGQFLQSKEFCYISLNTFYSCKKKYFIVEYAKDSFVFRERLLHSAN